MSKIQWTDETWNPVVGCSIVSSGCKNCYAMRMAARLEKISLAAHYDGTTKKVNGKSVWTGKVNIAPDGLFTKPLRWRKPRRVFVNSMSDLFHENLPDEAIDRVFAVMALAPQHKFQVLTKRPERMRAYCASDATVGRVSSIMAEILHGIGKVSVKHQPDGLSGITVANVWLGVSVEDQATADERIPLLLETPAAIRFVSYEPALAAVDFSAFIGVHLRDGKEVWRGIDWLIIGGESGPKARPFDIQWARLVIAQCRAAGVACFVKQCGSNPYQGRCEEEPNGNFVTLRDRKGGDISEFPDDLQIREFPA